MSNEPTLCDGRETYSLPSVIYENVVIAAQLGLGAILMSSWRLGAVPYLSLGFLVWAAVMLGYVLR